MGHNVRVNIKDSSHVTGVIEVEVEVNLRPTVSWPACLGAGLPSGSLDHIYFISLFISLSLCS
jgi:hypothetical protein